jgi:two-component system LytT family sensor kinase
VEKSVNILTPQPIIHLVGFLTGLMLFLILLTLVVRNRRGWPVVEAEAPQPLILVAALIGLVWNFGALIIYGARDLGLGSVPLIFEAAVFSSLGYLPAVVVHSVLSSESGISLGRGARAMIFTAYGLSLVATGLHLREALQGGEPPSVKALETLTIGFGALTIGLVIYPRRPSLWKRMIWLVALSFYAVSAFHLSRHIGGEDPWFVELIGHHSSLPLVWAMLYRDYRFALADIFLKRALAVLALVGMVLGLVFLLGGPDFEVNGGGLTGLFGAERGVHLPAGLLLIGIWFTTTLAFPRIRRGVDWLVDAVILRREDYQQLKDDLARLIESGEEIEEILDAVCVRLRGSFTASEVVWEPDEGGRAGGPLVTMEGRQTTILLPTQEAPHYRVRIAELSGGRRFLSDDLALLESVALILVRRLDAVRVVKERYARSLREQEMSKLATEAELRALRAQLNPHFLFNALTTIGYLIRTEPERAVETLLKLTGVLRAVLRAPDGGMVRLGEEIDLIESYLAVERARFEERLRVRIDVPPALLRLRIPALLLQPLVENAIKHGITPSLRGGELQIVARLEADNGRWTENGADWLRLEVNDTGVGVDPKPGSAGTETSGGVGLENVRRRLRGIYGDQAALSFSSRVGVGTSVTIRMPMPREVVTV